MQPDLPKTLLSIQALRALAAASVVVYHALFMLVHNGGYSFAVPTFGASGVDLFFAISGFIMVYTTRGLFCQPEATVNFIRRRAIRIVPIYWLCTTGVVLLLLFAPRLFSDVKFDLKNTVFSYLLLLSRNSAGQIGTVVQTGWSLCFEVYFYLLFAILLNLPRQYFLIVSGVVFAAGIAVGASGTSVPVWLVVATDPILLEFFLGAVIAFLFIRGFYLPRSVAIGMLVIGIAAIVATREVPLGQWTRVACWGIPGGFLLIGAISLERAGMQTPRLLVALGNSSYSLYLVHPFLIPAFGKAWVALALSQHLPAAILLLTAVTFSLAAGHAMYLVVETPMIRHLSKIAGTTKAPALSFRDHR